MRALSRRSGALIIAAALVSLAPPAFAETDDAIARLLAETGAGKPDNTRAAKEHKVVPRARPAADDERRMIEEVEMLERARAEAEARHASGRPRAEPPGDATADRVREEAAAEARRIAAEERRASEQAQKAAEESTREERRMAEEKRLEEERKRTEQARLAAEQQRKADEERRIAEQRQREHEAEYARLDAEREAEAVRIDEALRKARQAWMTKQHERAETARRIREVEDAAYPTRQIPTSTAHTQREAQPAMVIPDRALLSSTRVTVLMVLEPGSRGIRRHNKTADPLLCGEKGCYVGSGAGTPASFLPRRSAFGISRTLGDRAGACRNSLGCVFRDVDLVAYPAVVQPIDMRLMRHDRRAPHVLDEASQCRLDNGRLSCTPVRGPDYVMWIVPEAIAERAGASELARVVEAGLRSQSASLDARD